MQPMNRSPEEMRGMLSDDMEHSNDRQPSGNASASSADDPHMADSSMSLRDWDRLVEVISSVDEDARDIWAQELSRRMEQFDQSAKDASTEPLSEEYLNDVDRLCDVWASGLFELATNPQAKLHLIEDPASFWKLMEAMIPPMPPLTGAEGKSVSKKHERRLRFDPKDAIEDYELNHLGEALDWLYQQVLENIDQQQALRALQARDKIQQWGQQTPANMRKRVSRARSRVYYAIAWLSFADEVRQEMGFVDPVETHRRTQAFFGGVRPSLERLTTTKTFYRLISMLVDVSKMSHEAREKYMELFSKSLLS